MRRSPTASDVPTSIGQEIREELVDQKHQDPEVLKARLRQWLREDSRAQQVWAELENFGVVAKCEANRELLKTVVPLAQYVLGLELQMLGQLRSGLEGAQGALPPVSGRPSSRGERSGSLRPPSRGERSGSAGSGLEPVAAVNLGMLVRDVAQEVAPLDASPIKRLARVLKDDKAATAPGPVSTEDGRAVLTALAKKVHKVLDMAEDRQKRELQSRVGRRGSEPPPPPQPVQAEPPRPVIAIDSPSRRTRSDADRAPGTPVSRRTAPAPAAARGGKAEEQSRPAPGAAPSKGLASPAARAAASRAVQTSPMRPEEARQQPTSPSAVAGARSQAPASPHGGATAWDQPRESLDKAREREEREKKKKGQRGSARGPSPDPSGGEDEDRRRSRAGGSSGAPSRGKSSREVANPGAAEAPAPRPRSPSPDAPPPRDDRAKLRALQEENKQLRAQVEADKAEKAKLNIELDELRYQVQQLLKRLRAKGGAAFEALLEGDDFVAKIAGGLDNRDNVFNRLYNDAMRRLERLQELRVRVMAEHERELTKVLPTMFPRDPFGGIGAMATNALQGSVVQRPHQRPHTVPDEFGFTGLSDAEAQCDAALELLRQQRPESAEPPGDRPVWRGQPLRVESGDRPGTKWVQQGQPMRGSISEADFRRRRAPSAQSGPLGGLGSQGMAPLGAIKLEGTRYAGTAGHGALPLGSGGGLSSTTGSASAWPQAKEAISAWPTNVNGLGPATPRTHVLPQMVQSPSGRVALHGSAVAWTQVPR